MVYAQRASVLENGTYKLLWDFDIQTDHLISAGQPDLIIINKKKENLQCCGFWKKTIEHEGDTINRDWCFWYSHQRIIKGTRGFGCRRTSGDHPNYYIIKNRQNTEKSPGDLRRFVVTQREKTSAKTGVKKSQGVTKKIISFQRTEKGLKKLWNMKVMVIAIVFETLGTVFKSMRKWLEERVKNNLAIY